MKRNLGADTYGIIRGMLRNPPAENIDYLVVGHLTRDLVPGGEQLGGSAAFAARTAKAFGLQVGMLTSWAGELEHEALEGIAITNIQSEQATTFENRYDAGKRSQTVHALAEALDYQQLPVAWRSPKIVHLAPVLGEISPRILRNFPESTIGVTPQGWLRTWESDGSVGVNDWPEASFVLPKADAAVISMEDVGGDAQIIDSLAASAPVLVVTEAEKGARIFSQGEVIDLGAKAVEEVDATGAGDIFAAAFFIRLHFGDDLYEAGRVANSVAAQSVERVGMSSTPTPDEIFDLMPKALPE